MSNCRVLFVCLGNICRSPAAESIFLNKIHLKGIQDQFVVDSAGTGAWHVGSPADLRMRSSAKKRGLKISSIARQIEIDDLRKFNKILTMDKQNYADLKQLAFENGISVKEKLDPILNYACSTRLTEVPDPYYGGEDGFDVVLDLLEEACEGLIDNLIS